MSPKWVVVLLCLMLMGQAETRKITAEELSIMQKGLEAGKQFTHVLEKGTFKQFVAKADTFAAPFMQGIDILFKVIEAVQKEAIIDEIIKGFRGVNANLDRVIRKIADIKNLIEWQDMQVRFADIEYKIRLLDDTLKQVLMAPDSKASIQNFQRVHSRDYGSAGFALYDAVANNDQVFSRNLLTAAIKFSAVNRDRTHTFSKGLYGLLLKAMSIELANEKFSKINLGKNTTWGMRLHRSMEAMKAADNQIVTEAWKPQIKLDVDAMAKEKQSIGSNQVFADTLYIYLIQKYYWRNFLVTAFESSDSPRCQASVLPEHGVRGLKKHKRSYFVVSTDPASKFNTTEAYSYCRDYTCEKTDCDDHAAVWMMRLSPDYGVARMVVADHFVKNWGFMAKAGRYIMHNAALTDSDDSAFHRYKFIYFG